MICPMCGKEFFRPPAVYRRNPSVLICSRCGTHEALEDLAMEEEKIEGIIEINSGDDAK